MARSRSSNKRKSATKKKSAGSRDSRKTKRSTTKKSSTATKKTKSVSSVKKVAGRKDMSLTESDMQDIERDGEMMHQDISRISRQLQQVQGGMLGGMNQDPYSKKPEKSCYLPDGPRAGYGETCFSDGSLKSSSSSAVTSASHVLYTDSGITVRGDYDSLVRIRSSIYSGKGSITAAGSEGASPSQQQPKKDILPSTPALKPTMTALVGKPDQRAISDYMKGAFIDETNERVRNTFYKCIESLST